MQAKYGKIEGHMFVADRRVYLDAEGNVTDNPPSSGVLLAGEGLGMPVDEAKAFGLVTEPPKRKKSSTKAVKPQEDK